MGLRKSFVLLLFFLLLGFATPSFIRYEVLENSGRTGRSLLQQKRDCPIDMENQNYTIVTSQCKGPHYSAKICCGAFKELACKHRDELNAMNNNCATVMFNYLHLYGKYPSGLFGNLCKEEKEGLNCEEVDRKQQQQEEAAKKSAAGKLPTAAAPLLLPAFLASMLLL